MAEQVFGKEYRFEFTLSHDEADTFLTWTQNARSECLVKIMECTADNNIAERDWWQRHLAYVDQICEKISSFRVESSVK